jgi:hypothetical protein
MSYINIAEVCPLNDVQQKKAMLELMLRKAFY